MGLTFQLRFPLETLPFASVFNPGGFIVLNGEGRSASALRFRTIATRENPTSVLYDPTHARFYAAVPGENSIYVLAEATGTL